MRLLIIEDENLIAEPLKKALERDGFAVDWESNGREGLSSAQVNEYDCILLDLNLPEVDGIEIAEKLRQENIQTPILMLTARSQIEDKITGFESGADDYLPKPFNYKELLLRIRALIKRNSQNQEDIIKLGNIEINLTKKSVQIKKRLIDLSNKEYSVLEYLVRNRGRAVGQEELLEHVWDDSLDTFSQTVKVTLNTLRKKIDPEKEFILTKKGQGYVIY